MQYIINSNLDHTIMYAQKAQGSLEGKPDPRAARLSSVREMAVRDRPVMFEPGQELSTRGPRSLLSASFRNKTKQSRAFF